MKTWILFITLSFCLHLFAILSVNFYKNIQKLTDKKMTAVKITIIDKKPLIIPPKKKHIHKSLSERRRFKKQKKNVRPVQGLSAISPAPKKQAAMAAPLGNTLLRKDEGLRLPPEKIQDLNQNLSADAVLIRKTFLKPEYTEEALYANLEGTYTVDVFVDEKGNPLKVDLSEEIGYGMDERISQSILNSKFLPRKNSSGNPIKGWTELVIKLVLP